MNANQHLVTQSASGFAPFVDPLATVGTRLGQRLINLRAFQAKYDAMLYMVECMVSLQTLGPLTSAQAKTIADLKSLVIHERNELGIRQAEKF